MLLSEIVGSLYGKQKLRVWGVGEVNRKSVAGTVACFLGSLVLCLVWSGPTACLCPGWASPWSCRCRTPSSSSSLPEGTDDFTMATANALVCWAFGAWVL